ncbi:hypothetical protein DTO027B5_7353 [Paecilomyces variotii]|nr:hypothetical protein DTO027B3_4562 [Paecilomyces variotii]KAJ9330926.1 hypothetical protein DTO027B5_7353 [Paecilomyces variotii]
MATPRHLMITGPAYCQWRNWSTINPDIAQPESHQRKHSWALSPNRASMSPKTRKWEKQKTQSTVSSA